MENGAKGVEVIISGKLRAQRAKALCGKGFWSRVFKQGLGSGFNVYGLGILGLGLRVQDRLLGLSGLYPGD